MSEQNCVVWYTDLSIDEMDVLDISLIEDVTSDKLTRFIPPSSVTNHSPIRMSAHQDTSQF